MGGSILTRRHGAVATVALSNPGKLNAVDYAMWGELKAALEAVAAEADAPGSELRVVVITGEADGATPAFAAGGDLEEFLTLRATLDQALHYHDERVAPALNAIANCPLPTVAAINGPCIGGGLEIAAACDLRIASASSRFGAPINRLGFSMYPGEMAGLVQLAGPAVVLEILLEGRVLGADEAYAKGLLTRVVEDTQWRAEVDATVARIAAGAPLVARWHKQWVRRLLHDTPLSAAEKADSFAFLATDDYKEGLRAFFAKEKPRFSGR